MKAHTRLLRLMVGVAVAVLALGAASSRAAPYFTENFNGGVFPPPGWLVVNDDPGVDGNMVTWTLNTELPEAPELNLTGGTGDAAMADSLGVMFQSYDTSLISPTIAVPTPDMAPELTFLTRFESFSGSEAVYVDVSTDSGGTWVNLLHFQDPPGGAVAGLVRASLAAQAGQDIQVRFRYRNADPFAWDLFSQVDDVMVVPEPGTVVTLALGAVALLWRRRRRET
jgi:hypothetical protein